MEALEPRKFGEYTLVKKVGTGGMADIWRAQIRGPGGFKRELAIKTVHAQHADDQTFITMLLDEARIAARLVHPNIAQVLNCGAIGGIYFIAMEFINGFPLNNVLNRLAKHHDRFTPEESLFISIGLLRALGHAHSQEDDFGKPLGIIHRDVSPQNLMVSYSGDVKLVDFGVARAADKLHKTETGIVRGKLAYMAPEHLEGAEMDHRSDQFAAALVCLELLANSRAYEAQTSGELVRKVLAAETRDISDMLEAVPSNPRLAEVLARAVSVKPEARFPDCDSLASELTEILNDMAPGFSRGQMGTRVKTLFAPEWEIQQEEVRQIETALREKEDDSFKDLTDPETAVLPITGLSNLPGMTVGAPTAATPLGDGTAAMAFAQSPSGAMMVPEPAKTSPVVWVGMLLLLLGVGIAGVVFKDKIIPPATASVKVLTVPAGAQVRIANRPAPNSTPTLLGGVKVANGVPVTAELNGYKPAEVTVDLHEGLNVVRIELTRITGGLRVRGARPGAQVIVAGEAIGHADSNGQLLAQVGVGKSVLIKVDLGGGRFHEVQMAVGADGEHEVRVPSSESPRGDKRDRRISPRPPRPTPTPRPVATKAKGRIDVACLPWCKISVDGKATGMTSPLREYEIAAGSHLIEVVNPPSGLTAKKRVMVEADKRKRVNFRLD